ncbi:MAG: SDR family oxidoreductase [Spongiibacteraceae bacterium]|nr:SDR family oxidoreductase [Spongiibacteraceae bacterium]
MAIIVTGASGQFGRTTTQELLKRVPASELILTTRNPDSLAEFAALGAQVRYASFDDPESLDKAFVGGTRMLLISTLRVGSRVEQHQHAIEAAKRAGVTHVVYTSVIGADREGNPGKEVWDHRDTENLLKASGMHWTFLRNSQYAEAVAQVIAPIAVAAGTWPGSAHDGGMAFVSRDDLAECAAVILSSDGHENKAYDLTGPEMLSMPKAIALISEVSGKPVEYRYVTDEEMQAHFDSLGFPRTASDNVDPDRPWSSDGMLTFEQAIREGFFAVCSDHVEQLIGRKPRSLRDVLMQYRDGMLPRA